MFINRQLLGYMRGEEWACFSAILAQVFVTLLGSLTALFSSRMLRRLLLFEGRQAADFLGLSLAILASLGISFFLFRYKVKLSERASIGIKDKLRTELLTKLFLLGPAYLSKQRTGALASSLTSKVEWLRHYYVSYLPAAVAALVNLLIFLSLVFWIDRGTGLMVMFASLAMLLIPMQFYGQMKKLGLDEWKAHAHYHSECLDAIQGNGQIKAMNASVREAERLDQAGESFRKAVMAHLKITVIESSLLEFFSRVGSVLSLVFLAHRYKIGAVTEAEMIHCFFYVSAIFVPMLILVNAWHMGFQGVAASVSIREILEAPIPQRLANPAMPDVPVSRKDLLAYFEAQKPSEERPERQGLAPEICFDRLSFRYEPSAEKKTLAEISLRIAPGEMLALLGASGAGKSSLAKLLAGFYLPESGEIRVDGKPMDSFHVEALQSKMAAVWQDSHLFYGTIADNLRMGRQEASKEALIEAAKAAQIHEVIEALPEGYDSLIGERGGHLSGGERQRLCLARAFLRDAAILIFDEATSSLDRSNEAMLQESFRELRKDKTVLVIAHRLSTILEADRMAILDQGHLLAHGSHEDLAHFFPEEPSLLREERA